MHWHGPSRLKGPVLQSQRRAGCRRDRDRPLPEVRRELVERIRREIAEGAYETPEKWEAALARLLRRLEPE